MRISFCDSASVSLKTGMPVHIETMSAISSSPICGWSAAFLALPALLELALLLRQLPLLVAQRCGLLELLGLDRVFLLAANLRDLVLELRGSAEARSCS